MKNLKNLKYWLFDLDNTLYSGHTKVFDQVDKRMTKFISTKLNLSSDDAKKIQKNYFQEYNTTLNGMIKNHKIDAYEFLDFVHDIDLEFLKEDKELGNQISKIKGKKIIFTTNRIGIKNLFDGIFDIVDSDFMPKPSKEPYQKIVEKFKIEPQYCIFIEDIARNLKPAYELGMKTVWIINEEPWAAKFSESNFIDYRTDNLTNFLKEINE